MAEKKLPAIQFYPGDWLQDDVAGCSLAAQGLWLRMLFIAHTSEQRGYVGSKLVPMAPEAIARRCGTSLEVYTELLSELEIHGVPSRTPGGTLFSRRMIRDEKSRQLNKFRQRDFRKSHPNSQKIKGNSNGDVTAMSHPSSFTSSSSVLKPPTPLTSEIVFDHDMVATAVMAETGAHGMETRIVIAGIALNEIAKGRDGLDVKDHLIRQWFRYREVMPRMQWQWGSALKFFGSGLWASEDGWPWEKGQRPARTSPLTDPLDEQRRERQQAMDEKHRLEQERGN